MSWVASAIAVVGAGVKIGTGIHQRNLAKRIKVPDAKQTVSPYAQDNLSLAKQMFNSRMPGAAAASESIMANNANTAAGIDRNATDGAQSLALKVAAQGNTDNAFNNLRLQEGQYTQQSFANLQGANRDMTMENDKQFQEAVRQQMLRMQEKNQLGMASGQNLGAGLNELGAAGGMYDTNRSNKQFQDKYLAMLANR